MSHNKNDDNLEAIKARDAELHYCRTCGNRVYVIGDDSNAHFFSVEECNRRLAKVSAERIAEGKYGRDPDPETGHLCWNPDAHHTFLEGPIPDYERAERDRRILLGVYVTEE